MIGNFRHPFIYTKIIFEMYFPRAVFSKLTIAFFFFVSCHSGGEKESNPASVIIGNQEWMTTNLDAVVYANGDSIPFVAEDATWSLLNTGAWSYYGNSSDNGEKYGRLYNWFAVSDPRGLCPKGWRVASNRDWDSLIATLEGAETSAKHLKLDLYWAEPKAEITNSSGFSALPAGNRREDGGYNGISLSAPFWTSTEADSVNAVARFIHTAHSRVGKKTGDKRNGLACRCVRDVNDRKQ